jgi:hypothetical protein
MNGAVSFHPVDVEFFDELVGALVAGRKVNPEPYLEAALRVRQSCWQASRYVRALELALEALEPVPREAQAGILGSLKSKLDQITYRPDKLSQQVADRVDADLHLRGRPFFITETASERVSEMVDEYVSATTPDAADSLALEQLVRLDAALAKQVDPVDGSEMTADFAYRSDLLGALREIYDLANAARAGSSWGRPDQPRRPALQLIRDELPWRAVTLHARTHPFWIAWDVDGLDTVCRAAGLEPPGFLVPAWRLFAESCEQFPDLKEALGVEIAGKRGVGAFVSPGDIPEMLDFLQTQGSKIIREATRHGVGQTCLTLLCKIRECASYAQLHGLGYLEATGVLPPDADPEDEPAA